jgi:biopolymer transport protein ExbD
MMSKTKSGTWRGLRALYVLPLIGAVLACNAQTVTDYKVSENPQETKVETTSNVIKLDLRKDADGNVHYYVNGTETAFDGIGDAVLATWRGDYNDIVAIYSDPDIDYGYVDDIKNVLRGIKALKIMYTSKKGTSLDRRLPPSREHVEAVGGIYDDDPLSKCNPDNICVVRINAHDKVLYSTADGQLIVARDGQAGVDQFIADAAASIRQLEPNGIFSFQCDRSTSYETYVTYQEALMMAYSAAREEYATETYKKSLDALSDEERSAVFHAVPLNIHEAETKNGHSGR